MFTQELIQYYLVNDSIKLKDPILGKFTHKGFFPSVPVIFLEFPVLQEPSFFFCCRSFVLDALASGIASSLFSADFPKSAHFFHKVFSHHSSFSRQPALNTFLSSRSTKLGRLCDRLLRYYHFQLLCVNFIISDNTFPLFGLNLFSPVPLPNISNPIVHSTLCT